MRHLVFTGRIAAPTGPLIIGRCSDKDAFYGYIDMVGTKTTLSHNMELDCLTSIM